LRRFLRSLPAKVHRFMDEFLDLPTIIAIIVAAFVLFRLRNVLGTRTGNERPPVERRKPANDTSDDTVVPLRPHATPAPDLDDERRARKLEAEIEQYSRKDETLIAGFKSVAEVDPTFTPKSFLDGAKQAYEMIVTAFATGDRATLKNLLEKDVYDGFVKAISDREAAGYTVDFTFVGLPKVEYTEAEFDKRNVMLTVRFNAEVVSATRDKDGNLIEGNADQVQNIADEWTFARNPKSRDPNWKVVTTSQAD
jgi:predicted lipid-binding transport protein (Tim44 family)